jgi:hypothetical protein
MSIENEIAILTDKNKKLLNALYVLFGTEDPKELLMVEGALMAHPSSLTDPTVKSSILALKTVREINAS